MTRLLGISGSLRAASYNTALLRAAQSLTPDGVDLDLATLHGIPLYDGDVEQRDGIPRAVGDLKERIRASDGLIFATPEYNNGIPGVFKNAIDWLSRPAREIPQVFGERPVALVGASAGNFGTTLAQAAWLPVLRTLGTRPYTGAKLMVSRAGRVFDEDGTLTDDDVRKRLGTFLESYARLVGERD